MDLKPIIDKDKNQFNELSHHVMQSWEWGEFRKKVGTKVLRYGLYDKDKLTQIFQLTLHKIPFINSFVGYLPKGDFPDEKLAEALKEIGKKNNCAFIKVEPEVIRNTKYEIPIDKNFTLSPKPYFTKYNFVLDLTKSEEELLKNMHQKARYNIKVAQKHGVWVEERTDDEALETYLKLYFATNKRQGFLGHNEHYHRLVWKMMREKNMARIIIAFYLPAGRQVNQPIPLASWMLFNFKDTLYYPYGGSITEYKQVMAPNLLAWEAIKLGKKMGLKKFDLWGSGDPKAGSEDPYYGFTRFKASLGADSVEYIGTYDLIINPVIYHLFTLVDRFSSLKFFLLKLISKG